MQDVERGIVISIEHDTTYGTDVCTYTQRLRDHRATGTTSLAGILRLNRHDSDTIQSAVVVHPPDERPPTSIVNALGKVMVFDHVAYLQVFIGNQIVR